jgi:hypothetical protein
MGFVDTPDFGSDYKGPVLPQIERECPCIWTRREAAQRPNDGFENPVIIELKELEACDFSISKLPGVEIRVGLLVARPQVRGEIEPNLERGVLTDLGLVTEEVVGERMTVRKVEMSATFADGNPAIH